MKTARQEGLNNGLGSGITRNTVEKIVRLLNTISITLDLRGREEGEKEVHGGRKVGREWGSRAVREEDWVDGEEGDMEEKSEGILSGVEE